VPRAPRPEAGIAGPEVELLLVSRPVRNVALAVDAEHLPVRIDDRDAVEILLAGPLEERHGYDDAELACGSPQPRDRLVLLDRARQGEEIRLLLAAEVRALEQLGGKDDLRAARRRVAHVPLHALDVRVAGAAQRALNRGDGDAP